MRVLSICCLLLAACQATKRSSKLDKVATWAMQLTGIDRAGAVDRLVAAPVDMLVIDATNTVRGMESFPTRDLVQRIHVTGKLCLAYVNVGQAESYRTYWRPTWKEPTQEGAGSPSFIVSVDPEGWPDNYPVAFWDLRWKAVLWGAPDSMVDRAIADGFDGVYLDWVLGFEEPAVARLRDDTGAEMVKLIRDLRLYAHSRKPDFVVIAQNGAELPGLGDVVDGYAQEPMMYSGTAEASWDDAQSGDMPMGGSLSERLARLQALEVPVFTVDYAHEPENADRARALARKHGFRPFVSRTPLDRLP
jgi:cysteinyl-tRNA synthetase